MWDSQGEVQHVVEHAYKTESPICKMSAFKKTNKHNNNKKILASNFGFNLRSENIFSSEGFTASSN